MLFAISFLIFTSLQCFGTILDRLSHICSFREWLPLRQSTVGGHGRRLRATFFVARPTTVAAGIAHLHAAAAVSDIFRMGRNQDPAVDAWWRRRISERRCGILLTHHHTRCQISLSPVRVEWRGRRWRRRRFQPLRSGKAGLSASQNRAAIVPATSARRNQKWRIRYGGRRLLRPRHFRIICFTPEGTAALPLLVYKIALVAHRSDWLLSLSPPPTPPSPPPPNHILRRHHIRRRHLHFSFVWSCFPSFCRPRAAVAIATATATPVGIAIGWRPLSTSRCLTVISRNS